MITPRSGAYNTTSGNTAAGLRGMTANAACARRAWDELADPFSSAVKVTVSRLRRKLGDPPLIQTIPQAGYRIGQ